MSVGVRPRALKCLCVCLALCALLPAARAGQQGPRETGPPEVPTVSYCDLIKNPRLYAGKTVRVSGTYRVGFEWEELYCADCFDVEQRTWVEFEDEECKGSKGTKADSTANVVFVGKFSGPGGFGHMGVYAFQLTVSCVEKYKRIMKGSPHALWLRENEPKVFELTHCAAPAVPKR